MPTYFTLTLLEGGWNWQDFDVDGMDYEYCTTVLEIPEETIDYIEVLDSSLEILLLQKVEYTNETWYVKLINLSKNDEITA